MYCTVKAGFHRYTNYLTAAETWQWVLISEWYETSVTMACKCLEHRMRGNSTGHRRGRVWTQQKTESESLHTLGASAAPTQSCWTWGEQTNISGPEENSRGPMEVSILGTVSKYLRGAIFAPRLLPRESDRQLSQRHQYTPRSCYKHSQKAHTIFSVLLKMLSTVPWIYPIEERFLFVSAMR